MSEKRMFISKQRGPIGRLKLNQILIEHIENRLPLLRQDYRNQIQD